MRIKLGLLALVGLGLLTAAHAEVRTGRPGLVTNTTNNQEQDTKVVKNEQTGALKPASKTGLKLFVNAPKPGNKPQAIEKTGVLKPVNKTGLKSLTNTAKSENKAQLGARANGLNPENTGQVNEVKALR